VKIALLFFLLITHGCDAPASWATRHTTVCLDTFHGTFSVLNLKAFVNIYEGHCGYFCFTENLWVSCREPIQSTRTNDHVSLETTSVICFYFYRK